ncbi:MAG: hypothetical protein ABFD25_22755, partial [Clostridiaceae bacterium]
ETQQNQTQDPLQNVQQKAPDQKDTPKLYAGKYKTPEDMEKAYMEAQKTLTQTRMELSSARKNSNPAPQDTSKQNQQPQQEQNFDWDAAYKQDPVRATYLMIQSMLQESVKGITGQLEPIKTNFELSRVLDDVMGKDPDFTEYSDKAVELLEKSPELYSLPNYLEVAYRLAKADDLQTKAETAFEAGKNAAYNLDQQKEKNVFDNKSTKDEAQLTPEESILKGIMGAGGAWRSFGH